MASFFDQSEVLDVLQVYNPWWTGRDCSIPEFRRLAFQAVTRHLSDTTLKRAILLSGPRRVGKTTVLLQIADALLKEGRDPKSIVYLSLDHPLLKLLSIPKILRLYHETVYEVDKPA